jgi:hypothetical protein
MTKTELKELLGTDGLLRTQDLEQRGVPRKTLKGLSDQGVLEKLGRGLYEEPAIRRPTARIR